MTFCAPGSGRAGCVMAAFFLTTCVMVFGLVGAEKAEPTRGSPPAFTLLTLITGTCQDIQQYVESVVGTGVLRSAVEVQRGGAPPFFSALGSGFIMSSFLLIVNPIYWLL